MKGTLYVISAASGAGKTSFLQAGTLYRNSAGTEIQAAHVAMQLAAFALSAGLAGLALSHTIARAMIAGFVTEKIGFFRTPKRAKKNRLFSALNASREEGLFMVVLLLSLVFSKGLGGIYLAGVLLVAGLLIYEHLLVKPDDLSRLDAAFFNMNGYISVTIFLFTFVDALV